MFQIICMLIDRQTDWILKIIPEGYKHTWNDLWKLVKFKDEY